MDSMKNPIEINIGYETNKNSLLIDADRILGMIRYQMADTYLKDKFYLVLNLSGDESDVRMFFETQKRRDEVYKSLLKEIGVIEENIKHI